MTIAIGTIFHFGVGYISILSFSYQLLYLRFRNPVPGNMTFISLNERFSAKTGKALGQLLRAKGAESPKCIIFTSSVRETLEVKDMILEVC